MGSLSAYNSVNVPGGCPRIPVRVNRIIMYFSNNISILIVL